MFVGRCSKFSKLGKRSLLKRKNYFMSFSDTQSLFLEIALLVEIEKGKSLPSLNDY